MEKITTPPLKGGCGEFGPCPLQGQKLECRPRQLKIQICDLNNRVEEATLEVPTSTTCTLK